jgi:hypothetical protein
MILQQQIAKQPSSVMWCMQACGRWCDHGRSYVALSLGHRFNGDPGCLLHSSTVLMQRQ